MVRQADPDSAPESTAKTDGTAGKKERVIHTRVPAVLEQELKRFADHLRIPVSNLIRTILEDAVTMADRAGSRVEDELRSVIAHLHSERERLAQLKRPKVEDPFAGVLGFQPITMNMDGACARCGASLNVGRTGYLGLCDRPGQRILACARCLPEPKPEGDQK